MTKKKLEKGILKDFVLDLDKEIPPILNPFGFYPAQALILEGLWLPYSTDKGKVKAIPSVIVGTRHFDGDKSTFMTYDFKKLYDLDYINGFEVKGSFPERDFNLATKDIVFKLRENKTNVKPNIVNNTSNIIIDKYIWFENDDYQKIFIKFWIIGTYFYDVFDAHPILNISGVSESGKSRLLLLILFLAYHGYNTLNPTEAGIFRDKEELKPTMCIDEEEYLHSRERRSTVGTLINASYSKDGGWVTRHDEGKGGKRIRKRFYLYSPLAISGVFGLPGITKSRVIQVIMQRAEKNYPKPHIEDFIGFRNDLYILRMTKAFEIFELYHEINLEGVVSRRFDELFRPIFTICKYFGTKIEWDALVELANNYESYFRAEALNVSDEEQVLNCLEELIIEKEKTEFYFLKDLSEKINTKFNRNLSSNTVSDVLRRLKFTERKRYGKGTVFFATLEKVYIQKKRIGLVGEESASKNTTLCSQSSLSSPASVVSEECEQGIGKKDFEKLPQSEKVQKLKNYCEAVKIKGYKLSYSNLCFNFNQSFIEKCIERKILIILPDGNYDLGW